MPASMPSPGGDLHTTSSTTPDHADRVRGSVLAGAVGDALGYAVEFDGWAAIRHRFGAAGLTDLAEVEAPVISDDTQMTLFTLEGLTEALRWANEGSSADELACLWLAYLRWLRTQGELLPDNAPQPPATPLESEPLMRHRRAPGNACLSGLATGRMGTSDRPVNPESKGCGTVMRSAPFGLVPHVELAAMVRLSARGSALTHGHPTAGAAAGALTGIVGRIVRGEGLADAVRETLTALADAGEDAAQMRAALAGAIEAAVADRAEHDAGPARPSAGAAPGDAVPLDAVPLDPVPLDAVPLDAVPLDPVPLDPERLAERLGGGWIAEEALAIAVYCALVDADADPRSHLRRALVRAANHDGDSDSTAAIAGNIVGALHGTAALDPDWVGRLVERDVVEREVAAFLDAVAGGH